MFSASWIMQLIDYPLFKFVGKKAFKKFKKERSKRVMILASFFLVLELITGILLIWIKPIGISSVQVWIGLSLIIIIWITTWTIEVPQHKILEAEFNEKTQNILLKANWIRTVIYSLRVVIIIWMLNSLL